MACGWLPVLAQVRIVCTRDSLKTSPLIYQVAGMMSWPESQHSGRGVQKQRNPSQHSFQLLVPALECSGSSRLASLNWGLQFGVFHIIGSITELKPAHGLDISQQRWWSILEFVMWIVRTNLSTILGTRIGPCSVRMSAGSSEPQARVVLMAVHFW